MPALSSTVEQIEGTYDGTFTINQIPGEHRISLTFQQSGSEVTVTYRSAMGDGGSGKGTLAGNVIATVSLRSKPNCPGLFTASFKFSDDTVSFTYSGQGCNGPGQGRGIANKVVSPLTSEADKLTNKAFALAYAGKYAEAILVAHQVLAMREQLLGPDHPDVAAVRTRRSAITYTPSHRHFESRNHLATNWKEACWHSRLSFAAFCQAIFEAMGWPTGGLDDAIPDAIKSLPNRRQKRARLNK
jgi:hypothetical protein